MAKQRWIGVVLLPKWFDNHCLVMTHHEILFDPVVLNRDGQFTIPWSASQVGYGLSFRQF